MSVEGILHFQVFRDSHKVKRVILNSSRPVNAARIFHGKSMQEMLATLPLIYQVCGTAQANAAVNACENAMLVKPAVSSVIARDMLVWCETAKEHVWRILIDWSKRVNMQPDKEALLTINQLLPKMKTAMFNAQNPFVPSAQIDSDKHAVLGLIDALQHLLEESIFSASLDSWQSLTKSVNLTAWLENNQSVAARMIKHVMTQMPAMDHASDIAFLPELNDDDINNTLQDENADKFIAQPVWLGKNCETGSMARQRRHPLLVDLLEQQSSDVTTRTVARLVELASIPVLLREKLNQLENFVNENTSQKSHHNTGIGIGRVEAARGRLIHRVVLNKGKINQFQILAPTEWNFHPDGLAVRLISQLPASNEADLRYQAGILIESIDPCVNYEMVIH